MIADTPVPALWMAGFLGKLCTTNPAGMWYFAETDFEVRIEAAPGNPLACQSLLGRELINLAATAPGQFTLV